MRFPFARWCRPRSAGALVLSATLLLLTGPAGAQPVDIPPTWGGTLWDRPRLTGDWFGLRDEMGKIVIGCVFGAAGNPVDITGGEPPKTYQNTIRLGLEDSRIHALILGYWHTIVTPPMVFAKIMVEVVDEMRAKGITKPVVASLAGDVEVEEAAEYLFDHGIPAYPYSTEMPVMVLGAKYKWARGAGLI